MTRTKTGGRQGWLHKRPVPKARKRNITTEMRLLLYDFITNTPNLPEYIKPEVIRVVGHYINFMGSYLATIELLWRRTRDVVKEEG